MRFLVTSCRAGTYQCVVKKAKGWVIIGNHSDSDVVNKGECHSIKCKNVDHPFCCIHIRKQIVVCHRVEDPLIVHKTSPATNVQYTSTIAIDLQTSALYISNKCVIWIIRRDDTNCNPLKHISIGIYQYIVILTEEINWHSSRLIKYQLLASEVEESRVIGRDDLNSGES